MTEVLGRVEILADAPTLARHVATWFTEAALAATGPFRVSLSGGSTPKALYELLASRAFKERFPWQRVEWFGVMSGLSHTIILAATTEWSARRR
jgi:6-phosphogluconolactonase